MSDIGLNLQSTISSVGNTINAVGSAVNTAKNLSSAVSTAYNSKGLLSAIRSIDIPSAAEAAGDIMSAISSFGGDANSDDWRVRLSMPYWTSFKSSPVLAPLKDAGGLIFPYTPQITINSTAKYTQVQTVHTNYTFQAFQNSDPGSITITAPMNVEDSTQGIYWIAAVHYLRSLTKMFSGNDPKAGNPPPIVQLSGYGSYVFNNVPVVVQSFSVQLGSDCDYIPVTTQTSIAGTINSLAGAVGGVASAVGGAFGLQKVTDAITDITDGVSAIATTANSIGFGGSMDGGVAHVPAKSSFQITLIPMYSRTSLRKFSLDNFVSGSYLNNSFGYV